MVALSPMMCATGPGSEMARSDFNWGAEDWELFGPGKLKVYERGGMLYGSVSLSHRWLLLISIRMQRGMRSLICPPPGTCADPINT